MTRRRLVYVAFALTVTACAAGASPHGSGPPPATLAPSEAGEVLWPPAMNNPTAAWDPASGLVLLAGDAGGPGIELWGWDGEQWLVLDDGRGTAPSARDDIQLVADPERGVVWLHGGRTPGSDPRRPLSDTWRWDGDAWAQVLPDGSPDAPPARTHPVTAWDPVSQRVILYGGVDATDVFLTGTWAWDGSTWEQLEAPVLAGRWAPVGMEYDASRRAVAVMAVDLDAPAKEGLYSARLWYLDDSSAWEMDPVIGPAFSPIQPVVGTADGLLLVDGGTLQGVTTTWTWDGTDWHEESGGEPTPRNGHALAYDAARDRAVLFGGWDGTRDLNDLWEWDGSRWAQVTRP